MVGLLAQKLAGEAISNVDTWIRVRVTTSLLDVSGVMRVRFLVTAIICSQVVVRADVL